MDELSELLQLRRAKLDAWRADGIDPFGTSFPDTLSTAAVVADFAEEKAVRVAGRIVAFRDMGKSIFGHFLDQTGKLQFYANKQSLGGETADPALLESFRRLDLGDIVGFEGTLFTTRTGEKTIKVTKFVLLSKSLRPLPSAWHGLSDDETRYRQRYLDLIVNEDVRRTFVLRSKIVSEIRRYLEERGFLEVETPMMQAIAGGAAAQPFVTHHKALNLQLYLRIATELYLKRLLVGGFEKVFEINRNFRNEGLSRKHNPEFTAIEIYQAYADYEAMASFVEGLVIHLAQTVIGSLQVPTGPTPEDGSPRKTIDLSGPWPRKRYRDAVKEAAGADWFDLTPQGRRERAASIGVEIGADLQDHEVTNHVFEKKVEALTVNPVFITHLPKELVPLAKQNAEDPSVVDVFELLINGQEISPGYSELNDPIVQRQRLEEQVGEEVHNLDEDFLLALEHGMPPAGGIGIGIDRLIMLLTGAESIRDVILFPLLRPR